MRFIVVVLAIPILSAFSCMTHQIRPDYSKNLPTNLSVASHCNGSGLELVVQNFSAKTISFELSKLVFSSDGGFADYFLYQYFEGGKAQFPNWIKPTSSVKIDLRKGDVLKITYRFAYTGKSHTFQFSKDFANDLNIVCEKI